MLASTAQFLNLDLWGDALRGNLQHTAFWAAVVQIILINILLSGDNAVVIAMACRGLPPRQRLWGLVLGAGLAVVLRIVFTGVVARLMQYPYLKVAGGLALFYIAAKMLVPDDDDEDQVEAAGHLWRAVWLVFVADVVMSLDNIIAVGIAAQGNLALLVIGIVMSIPVIVAGAAFFIALLDRLPILVWAGAGLLGWVAGKVIATDPAVAGYVTAAFGADIAQRIELAAAGAGVVLVIAVGGLWRRLRLAKFHATESGEQTDGT